MVPLSTLHQNALKSLFNDAMAHAAVSFGKLLGAEIVSEPVMLFTSIADTRIYPCFKSSHELIVLVTPLIGDLPGKSFLVFDQKDLGVLYQSGFGKQVDINNLILQDAMLKEVDNIVSASFVTVISNRLSIAIFGDVPELYHQSSGIVNDVIHSYIPNGPVSMVCQSAFSMKQNPAFSVQFIWKVSADVLTHALTMAGAVSQKTTL